MGQKGSDQYELGNIRKLWTVFWIPEPEMPNHRQTRSRKMERRDDLREAIMERE